VSVKVFRTLPCCAAEIHDLDSKADFVLDMRNPRPNPRPNRLRNRTLNSPNYTWNPFICCM
jgi:hypothetical protein